MGFFELKCKILYKNNTERMERVSELKTLLKEVKEEFIQYDIRYMRAQDKLQKRTNLSPEEKETLIKEAKDAEKGYITAQKKICRILKEIEVTTPTSRRSDVSALKAVSLSSYPYNRVRYKNVRLDDASIKISDISNGPITNPNMLHASNRDFIETSIKEFNCRTHHLIKV